MAYWWFGGLFFVCFICFCFLNIFYFTIFCTEKTTYQLWTKTNTDYRSAKQQQKQPPKKMYLRWHDSHPKYCMQFAYTLKKSTRKVIAQLQDLKKIWQRFFYYYYSFIKIKQQILTEPEKTNYVRKTYSEQLKRKS